MSRTDICTKEFASLAEQLGKFGCKDLKPVVHIRNPMDLSNWTLPVIETLFIGLAIAALVYAVRSLRRGDRIPMVLWFGALVFFATTEPELYFPKAFGIYDYVGLIWVHNVFTVQFIWDRTPLYILAVYPALPVLGYALVRRLGIITRHGALTSALCVAFFYQCFYEIFDQIGPQLKWWLWNPAAASNDPMLGGVPLSSAYGMAVASPFAIVLLARLLFDGKEHLSRGSIALRTLAVGVGTPIGVALLQVPMSVLKGHAHAHARGVLMLALTAAVAVFAGTVMYRAWRETTAVDFQRDPEEHRFVLWGGGIYLAVLLGLWIYALPDTLGATDGVTNTGTLAGNIPYAAIVFVGALVMWLAATGLVRSRRVPVGAPELVGTEGS